MFYIIIYYYYLLYSIRLEVLGLEVGYTKCRMPWEKCQMNSLPSIYCTIMHSYRLIEDRAVSSKVIDNKFVTRDAAKFASCL